LKTSNERVVVAGTNKREVFIAMFAGMALLVLLGLGLMHMSSNITSNRLKGTIISKTFSPQPEEQISIGRAGLHERKVAGDYVFEVRVGAENKVYKVWVDKAAYDARKVGETFIFSRPQPAVH
jgi:hypothetical protein